jgi:hypothetical protein
MAGGVVKSDKDSYCFKYATIWHCNICGIDEPLLKGDGFRYKVYPKKHCGSPMIKVFHRVNTKRKS